jgi:hypothetical protein
MRALPALVSVTLVALASCSSGEMTTSPPIDSGGGTGGGDTTTSNGHVATCVPVCSAAADCGSPGDPLYDPSHVACTGGQCVWQGCTSASACSAEAQGGNFVCQATPGSPPTCIPACHTPADCVPPNNQSVLDNAAHYACNSGVCAWLGCASTAECSAALQTSKVSCEQPPGAPAKTCVATCTTPTDCAVQGGGTLNNASHYACIASRCQWLGCKSTAECSAALQSSRYVCE